LNLRDALEDLLDWKQRQRLEELAPTHMSVPSGARVRIDYVDADAPSLSVKVQELFGLSETPRIGGGTAPLLIKLLSPAQRPVQVTRDLASFWRSGYAEVRRELKGRYPRHDWPEDPLLARPSRGVRRR
jgi:ATP-dependent helicase HrpB